MLDKDPLKCYDSGGGAFESEVAINGAWRRSWCMEYTMPIFELYSKRKRRQERAGQPVYQYDEIPQKFRKQVEHIWRDAIGPRRGTSGTGTSARVWEEIYSFVSREVGLEVLGIRDDPMEKCLQLLSRGNTERVLDIIQASFNFAEHHFGGYKGRPEDMEADTGPSRPASPYAGVVRGYGRPDLPSPSDMAIEELNHRFLENRLGYQYENGRIMRIDSEYTHFEMVRPALQLLSEPEFKPAQDEFLKGHEDYRHRRYEDAINEALKAFESTMKIICEKRGWKVVSKKSKKPTASELIETCFEHELIPAVLERHFTSLASGLLAIRNAYSAHGDGVEPVEVPDYLAKYALDLAASDIVLFIKAYRTSTGS